jgi:ABC-type branched-subunit amino acid transport system substrate-binding protein
VTKAVDDKPDVIFITSLGGIPAKIMSGARQLGFTGQFLGGNGFNTAAVSKQAGASGKGAQSASACISATTSRATPTSYPPTRRGSGPMPTSSPPRRTRVC